MTTTVAPARARAVRIAAARDVRETTVATLSPQLKRSSGGLTPLQWSQSAGTAFQRSGEVFAARQLELFDDLLDVLRPLAGGDEHGVDGVDDDAEEVVEQGRDFIGRT